MATVKSNTHVAWSSCAYHESRAAVYLHTWVINHSSVVLLSDCEYLETAKCSLIGDSSKEWCLRLYPRRKQYSTVEYTGVDFVFFGAGKISARCKVCIINTAGEEVKNFTTRTGQARERYPLDIDLEPVADIIRFVNENFPDDILRLRIEVTILDCSSSPVAYTLTIGQGSSLKDDFIQVWQDREFADLIIIAGEKRFHVHKVVLAMRSPVFRAMLKNQMKESVQSEVVLGDVSPDVVQEMLAFIYTDTSPNISSMAADLYQLADKYDLKRLKAMCEVELASSFSVDTVVDVLRLADKCQSESLKKHAVLYINAHATDVGMTDGWKRMVKEELRLLEYFVTDGLNVV